MVRSLVSEQGEYYKETDTEIKWSIIRKSVTLVIFVDFIDPFIDYPINCASLINQSYIFVFCTLFHGALHVSWCGH